MNDNVKSNVIFNMQDSSLPSCFVSASEQPSKSFDPREPSHFRPDRHSQQYSLQSLSTVTLYMAIQSFDFSLTVALLFLGGGNSEYRPEPSNPPWPHLKDDGRGNFHPLDPYRGMQCVELSRYVYIYVHVCKYVSYACVCVCVCVCVCQYTHEHTHTHT